MIADSIKHIVHALISAYFLRRQIKGFGRQRFLQTAFKTSLAAIVMGVVGWLSLSWLISLFGTVGAVNQLITLLIPFALSGAVFLILAYLLRIDELRWLFGLVVKRLRG